MSKSNPRKAMAALLPVPIKVGRGLTVEPMTLGMFAALERIGSPMVSKREPKDLVELIPSLYLLTHGAKEIFRPDFFDAAFAWADTVPTNVVERIRTACYRQLNAAFDVIPEDDPKKKTPGNDGWIAALVHWAASSYGWSLEEILHEVPLAAICLLRRQDALKKNRIFPLSEIEKIDNGE